MHTDLKKRKKITQKNETKDAARCFIIYEKNQVDTSSFAGISPKRIL